MVGLRDGLGGEAVAHDRESGKRQAVCGDFGRGRQSGACLGNGGIDQVESLEHIHVPVEEEIYLGGAAAGQRSECVRALELVFTASSIGRVTVTSI